MSALRSEAADGVEALQRAFDQAFAEAPDIQADPHDDLLAITVGGNPYALRLTDVAGLHSDRTITWLPGSVPELLGLVGLRAALLPVYDVRRLLGYPASTAPRWCVVAAAAPVALGVERFDGYLRVPRRAVLPAEPGRAGDAARCVREVVHVGELIRPVIHVPSVLDAIAVLAHHSTRLKE
jgi:purine-binding chemotaxis protein CheW